MEIALCLQSVAVVNRQATFTDILIKLSPCVPTLGFLGLARAQRMVSIYDKPQAHVDGDTVHTNCGLARYVCVE